MVRLFLRAAGCAAVAAVVGCGAGVDGPPGVRSLLSLPTTFSLGAGSVPSSVVMLDLDGDGRLDLVVTDRGTDSVVVMRGTGDGAFGFPIAHSVGAGAEPIAVVAADFDRDGRMDLAVADRMGDDVAVFRGTGGGSLTPWAAVALNPGSQASGLVAADVNRDGKIDLVVSNRAPGSVSVALGFGDGTFSPLSTFPVDAGFRPSAIAAADFDRDGRLDLAVSSGTDGRVAVLLGDGSGAFGAPTFTTVDAGEQLLGLVTADCNRDGRVDVVVAGKLTSSVYVLLGNGDGTLGSAASAEAGPNPSAMAAGDFNADGDVDLAVALAGTGHLSLLLGHGDGTFEPGFQFGTAGTGAAGLAVGDADGNGALDVAVANGTSADVGVLLGRSHAIGLSLRDAPGVPIGAGFEPASVVLADFDGDGKLDLAVADHGHDGVSIALGAGDGSFGAATELPVGVGTAPIAVAAADFDRDGNLDLAVANQAGASVSILLGSGTGTFALAGSITLPAAGGPSAIVLGDFDRDGRIDVAVANRALGSVSVALGHGDGTFFPVTNFPIGPGFDPRSIVAADFDRDGRLDLAVAGGADGRVAILFGDFAGSFGTAASILVDAGAELTSVTAADVNRNGKADLIVTNRTAGSVSVLLGGGNGSFGAPTAFAAGPGVAALAVGDFDRDGRVDIAVTLDVSGRLLVLRGDGDGAFRAARDFGAGGTGSTSIVLGDLDRDDLLDAIVANRASGDVGVRLGP